jgi:hypothetical protein
MGAGNNSGALAALICACTALLHFAWLKKAEPPPTPVPPANAENAVDAGPSKKKGPGLHCEKEIQTGEANAIFQSPALDCQWKDASGATLARGQALNGSVPTGRWEFFNPGSEGSCAEIEFEKGRPQSGVDLPAERALWPRGIALARSDEAHLRLWIYAAYALGGREIDITPGEDTPPLDVLWSDGKRCALEVSDVWLGRWKATAQCTRNTQVQKRLMAQFGVAHNDDHDWMVGLLVPRQQAIAFRANRLKESSPAHTLSWQTRDGPAVVADFPAVNDALTRKTQVSVDAIFDDCIFAADLFPDLGATFTLPEHHRVVGSFGIAPKGQMVITRRVRWPQQEGEVELDKMKVLLLESGDAMKVHPIFETTQVPRRLKRRAPQ